MVAKSSYEISGREQISYDSMTHDFKCHCVIIEQKKIDVKLSSIKMYTNRLKSYDKSLRIDLDYLEQMSKLKLSSLYFRTSKMILKFLAFMLP